MRTMLGWGRTARAPSTSDGPSFNVEEKDDAYVCKANVKLALPEQADAAHLKAELDEGELTLVVPKLAAATDEPKARRTRGNGRRASGRTRRRGAHTAARQG
jgi:HSP20 family molecular chaperone IbpA